MNRRQFNTVIRTLAKAVNPNGTFIPGTRNDGSLHYDAPVPQIHFVCQSARLDVNNAPTKVYNVEMYFCTQDELSNVPAAEFDNTLNPSALDPGAMTQSITSREELIAQMEDMATNFIMLIKEESGLSITVAPVDFADGIMTTAGGHSGSFIRFQASTTNGYCNV